MESSKLYPIPMFVLINLRLVNDSNSMFQKKNDAMDFPKDDALGLCQRRGFGMFPKTRIWDFSKDEDLGICQRRGFGIFPKTRISSKSSPCERWLEHIKKSTRFHA